MNKDEQIIKHLTQIIAAFWLMMKFISLKLWLTDRSYPLVPIVEMPAIIHVFLFIISAVLFLWLIIKPQNRLVMIALIITESTIILGDQTRLQPWHYQYLFTFFAIAFNKNNSKKAIQAIIVMTAATYLFSGLQKINAGFIHSVWSVHMLKRFFKVPDYIIRNRLVQWMGFIIPLIEIGGALGLLFLKTMKPATWLLIGMHIFILVFLGPFGINYNVVVWPWNVQMMLLLYLLFIKNAYQLDRIMFKSTANYVVAFCWVLLPILGLFGYWDKFLSAGMYSGRDRLMQYHFKDSSSVPVALRPFIHQSKYDTTTNIILTDWCVKELKVASVIEPRVVNSITRQLNERYAAQQLNFEIIERRH